jgi:HK97 family phage major capsid protein
MPPLKTEDVKDWGLPKLREEYGNSLDELQSIKEKNDGTLAGASGEDADLVKNLLDTTNVLGERIDELKSLDEADDALDAGRERLKGVNAPPQPGKGRGRKADDGPADLGGRFVESDAWKEFKEDGRKGVEVELPLDSLWPGYKGIGERVSTKALFDSSGYPIQPDFRPEPILELFQPNNIGPLMAQGSTSLPLVRTVVETVTSSGAATVAEGAQKPEAQIAFDPADEPVRKIAVWLPLTDESLDDIPFLRSYINARLPLFVMNEEDRQLLMGDGTGTNLTGIRHRSGVDASVTYSLGGTNPDQALIDAVFSGAMRVREAFLEPDAFATKPATWEKIRLAKNEQRNYLLGPPSDDAPVRLWGLRGVLNANMEAEAAGNKPVIVGAWQTGAMVVRRQNIALAMTDSHDTFFTENKLAIRAEERLAELVFRPAAFSLVGSAA